MKTTKLKWISIALSALMLMQSCVVYHSKTATVDEAVMSQDRVLVKTQSNNILKFKYLRKEGEQLYGITRRNNATANRLSFMIKEDKSYNEFVQILLSKSTVDEIHLPNKTLSTVLSVAIPLVSLIGVLYLFYAGGGLVTGPDS
jgi:hypothetical protein